MKLPTMLIGFVTAASVSAMAVASGGGNDDIFIRDVVTSNAGVETIVPFRTNNSALTTVTLRYDVASYAASSTTKLFQTTAHTFQLSSTSALACVNPLRIDVGNHVMRHIEDIAGHSYQIEALQVIRRCEDISANTNEVSDVLVYGADVSQSGGTTWYKTILNSSELDNMFLTDVNADSNPDVVIMMAVPGAAVNSTVRLYSYNPFNGNTVVASKDRVYSPNGW